MATSDEAVVNDTHVGEKDQNSKKRKKCTPRYWQEVKKEKKNQEKKEKKKKEKKKKEKKNQEDKTDDGPKKEPIKERSYSGPKSDLTPEQKKEMRKEKRQRVKEIKQARGGNHGVQQKAMSGGEKETTQEGNDRRKKKAVFGGAKKTTQGDERSKKNGVSGGAKKTTQGAKKTTQGAKKTTQEGNDRSKKNGVSGGVKKTTQGDERSKKNGVSGGQKKRKREAENHGVKKKRMLEAENNKTQEDEQSKKTGISGGKMDPFPGSAPVPEESLKKFRRKDKCKLPSRQLYKLRRVMAQSEVVSDLAQNQAARQDLLLPEDAGFLEGDEDEDTCTISQEDIADAVDITSGAKHFNLHLSQFGPYRLDYSKTGRQLLVGGRRGHVACLDWQSKQLMCEMNVMETVNDVKWLHSEAMFAVAQKKWLYIYDSSGIELHCIRKFNDVLRMQFLPYHFLLATASATGFLQYLDVSVGKEVAAIGTKMGRLDVMCQNPQNAIIHLGHSKGVVTLWSPNQKEALVKMLCHQGGVRSVTVDKTGTYMVTSGMDKKLKVYDIRTFKPLQSYFLPAGASSLSLSQRGLLSAATGDIVQVYRDVWSSPVTKPYMAHRLQGPVWGLQFCPFEDVLGVGHGEGFTSMVVPGAGEPNFDGLDANPYRSVKQRQEWEVKALLDKIQPELISLDPGQLGLVDYAGFEQRHQDRVTALGYDPHAVEKFKPRLKKKGRSSTGNIERRKKQVGHEDQREVIKKTVEDKMRIEKQREKENEKRKSFSSQRSALDRFKK